MKRKMLIDTYQQFGVLGSQFVILHQTTIARITHTLQRTVPRQHTAAKLQTR